MRAVTEAIDLAIWDNLGLKSFIDNNDMALKIPSYQGDVYNSFPEVGGRLRCFGSNQRLKARFGQGYQLEA